MSEKRLFQIFDEMNVNDINNKTTTVEVGNSIVSANYYSNKWGTQITIGVPGDRTLDLQTRKTVPILLLVDFDQYNKIKESTNQSNDSECKHMNIVLVTKKVQSSGLNVFPPEKFVECEDCKTILPFGCITKQTRYSEFDFPKRG